MTKNIEELKTIICFECEAEYTVLHGEFDNPAYCPFCTAEIVDDEEDLDDLEEYFDDED